MKSFDIIIFGARDWSSNWITQHRLAKSLSENNHRVLFVENTGIRSAKIRDFPRILKRLKNWRESIGGFKTISRNLTIFSPLVLPFPYNKTVNKLNNLILKRSLSKWIEKNRFNSINYITFLATPLINNYITETNHFAKIYYCGDDHEEASNNSNFPLFEKELASTTDINFATSQKLYERLNKYNKNTYKISAGVELSKFNINNEYKVPNELKKIKKPIIGYIGGFNEKLDNKIILDIAEKKKNYSIVMIGDEDGNFENKEKFLNKSNVHFLGKKKHSEISKYIYHFDCGIIPYKINKFTDAVYPSKLNEFLSLGKPVITTNFYEMNYFNKENKNTILVAKNNNFLELIEKSLKKKNKKKDIITRLEVAKKNQWINKFDQIYQLLDKLNDSSKIINYNWQKKFEIEYKKLKKRVYLAAFSSVIIFSLLFISPVPYYLGKYLEINDDPKKNSLIIALSGYGSAKYINNTYQQRSLDVFYYYKNGYGEKILLSGRKQLIEEFELMRSILISLGVPNTKIDIINQNFNSTYTNLELVNDYMLKNNIQSANLITSPYHQRRVKYLFNKLSNGKNIYLLPESKNEKEEKWFFSLNKIRVIFYEYMSLVYNKLKY